MVMTSEKAEWTRMGKKAKDEKAYARAYADYERVKGHCSLEKNCCIDCGIKIKYETSLGEMCPTCASDALRKKQKRPSIRIERPDYVNEKQKRPSIRISEQVYRSKRPASVHRNKDRQIKSKSKDIEQRVRSLELEIAKGAYLAFLIGTSSLLVCTLHTILALLLTLVLGVIAQVTTNKTMWVITLSMSVIVLFISVHDFTLERNRELTNMRIARNTKAKKMEDEKSYRESIYHAISRMQRDIESSRIQVDIEKAKMEKAKMEKAKMQRSLEESYQETPRKKISVTADNAYIREDFMVIDMSIANTTERGIYIKKITTRFYDVSNRLLVVRSINSNKVDSRNFVWPNCDFKYIDAMSQSQELRYMHKISAVYQGDFVHNVTDARITIEYNSGHYDELVAIDSLIASEFFGGGEGEELHTYQDICNVQANINNPVNKNNYDNQNNSEGTNNSYNYSSKSMDMSDNVYDNIDVICFNTKIEKTFALMYFSETLSGRDYYNFKTLNGTMDRIAANEVVSITKQSLSLNTMPNYAKEYHAKKMSSEELKTYWDKRKAEQDTITGKIANVVAQQKSRKNTSIPKEQQDVLSVFGGFSCSK
jgi:hypothetical protein